MRRAEFIQAVITPLAGVKLSKQKKSARLNEENSSFNPPSSVPVVINRMDDGFNRGLEPISNVLPNLPRRAGVAGNGVFQAQADPLIQAIYRRFLVKLHTIFPLTAEII